MGISFLLERNGEASAVKVEVSMVRKVSGDGAAMVDAIEWKVGDMCKGKDGAVKISRNVSEELTGLVHEDGFTIPFGRSDAVERIVNGKKVHQARKPGKAAARNVGTLEKKDGTKVNVTIRPQVVSFPGENKLFLHADFETIGSSSSAALDWD